MNICLLSAFCDSTVYIGRYFEQVDALHRALARRGDRVRLIVGEGDSRDATRQLIEDAIAQRDYLVTLLDVAHGGAKYGSVVSAQRFLQLSLVWNKLWAAIPKNYSAILFVESDLLWDVKTMLALLDGLDRYPAAAPKVLCTRINPTFYYDTWAFRKDGRQFTSNPPYFSDLMENPTTAAPVQIDSAGSVLAIRGALARKLTWPAQDVVVGVCRQIYEQGGSVWLLPTLSVNHP